MTDLLQRAASAIRRLLHLFARPVQGDRGRGGLYILPYRGYGSFERIFLMGRVFRQSARSLTAREDMPARDFQDVLRRLHRRGEPGARIRVLFAGGLQEVVTDKDGYFRVELHLDRPIRSPHLWHGVDLHLVGCADPASKVRGEVFIPPPQARFVVVSDIDDTVMLTGVANKVKMIWRLFIQGARSRIAFPGVGAFYRALHDGAAPGGMTNPILYVSRGPWGLYELLDEFFHLHRIPVGPILFLREWGFSWRRPFPRKARGHKRDLIERMLAVYPELPFVLIGDSGQHDAEIYAQVAAAHPNRIAAVYIRNVSRDPRRVTEIEGLARRLAETGSPLLLAADSFAMAEHAAEHGLIDASALREVVRERRVQREGRAPRTPLRVVEHGSPEATAAALREGELRERLDEGGTKERPPNVAVEPREESRRESD